MSGLNRWLGPGLLTALSVAFLLVHAVPRLEEGSDSLRHVYHALHDEGVILEGTWKMVERGDLSHGIKVYPGFYPYQTALIRAALKDSPPKTAIVVTRVWSLVVMLGAMLVTFVGLGVAANAPWVGAGVVVFMALNPEMIEWTSRVHPDAWLLLFDHAAIAALLWAVDRKSSRALLLATLMASFSAATKLVGCFLMVPIGLWICLGPGQTLAARVRQAFVHLFVFIFVFCATNPLLFSHGILLLRGLFDQHRRNRKGPGNLVEWLDLLVGPNGLGWAGLFLVILGLILFLRQRRRGLAVILGFATFYLSFILFGVKIVEARYAYPAVFPLLFFALATLAQTSRKIAAAVLAATAALYLALDLRPQVDARENLASAYRRELSADKLELARRLADTQRPGIVYTSAAIFVPEPIDWKIVWTTDEVPVEPRPRAVVLDELLQTASSAPAERLRQVGLVKTATVGPYVLFE